MKNIVLVLLVGLGLAFNSNAGMIYSADTINSNLRDISTTGTQFNLSDDDVANINIGFNFDFFDNTGILFAVPTPSTLAVFAFGLFALLTRRYTKS